MFFAALFNARLNAIIIVNAIIHNDQVEERERERERILSTLKKKEILLLESP
jgi:hypothetical protein